MATWQQGYPIDVEYVKHVTNKMSPAYIDLCLKLAGITGPDISAPFSYAELGAGFGLSMAGWAAQYPHATFHCSDYNKQQMQWLQQLATTAGLNNLSVYAHSVGELLQMDLPQYDFIAMHGFYSWVSNEVRAETLQFLRRFLKPGGCIYVAYNSKPGWSALGPMRNILVESAKTTNNKKHSAVLKQGLSLLKALDDCGATFFTDVPVAHKKLGAWLKDDIRYLLGELQSQEHRAFYFNEMATEMSNASLEWAGTLNMPDYLEDLMLPEMFASFLTQVSENAVLREDIKDMFFNTAFRSDLFIKPKNCAGVTSAPTTNNAATCNAVATPGMVGATIHTVAANAGSINNSAACGAELSIGVNGKYKAQEATPAVSLIPFALTEPQSYIPATLRCNGHEFILHNDLYPPLYDLLKKSPCSASAAANALSLPLPRVLEAMKVMTHFEWLHPCLPVVNDIVQTRVEHFNSCLTQIMGAEPLNNKLSALGGWAKK